MPPDSLTAITDTTAFFTAPQNFNEWLDLIKNVAAIIGGGGIVGLLISFLTKFLPWWRTRRDRVIIENGLSKDIYSRQIIEKALRYYVEPNCQNLDPAGGEESRHGIPTDKPIFKTIDDALNNHSEYHYIFLLADSGMGKTAFMINYYARNIRKRRRKYDVALLPLGLPDVDERIKAIPNQPQTVLFLDAFDEDTLAIVDHTQRLKDLLSQTLDFRKVLITCRTQFFPKEEEIPEETGVIKTGPREAGESGHHYFHKIYLTPFSNDQVYEYVTKRYPFWRFQLRRQAKSMVEKIPNLVIRPMLLTHINELIENNMAVSNAFELYEKMVEAWLKREDSPLVKKEPLRQFSEQLAVELWYNRKDRKSEQIHRDRKELVDLAKKWNIPLQDWQLTGRSLLNRDAKGNYKFSHRSIMEYLLVKLFIAGELKNLQIQWSDQMQNFMKEVIQSGRKRGELYLKNVRGADLSRYNISLPIALREDPLNHKEDIKTMLLKNDFFDSDMHKPGKGLIHEYQVYTKASQKVVIDFKTNLMWQQSGSPIEMVWKNCQQYIDQLNRKKYAGYNDWRMPTLEEAMSLMEREKKNGNLYIDPVFDAKQGRIWTADKHSASRAWFVVFNDGSCYVRHVDGDVYARAVRS